MNTNRTSEIGAIEHALRLYPALALSLLIVALTAQAAPPPTGVAPVLVPAGGFGIDGKLVADGLSGDWLPGSGGTGGVLDLTGAPLNPATTFHFIDRFNSTSDNVFGGGVKWDDNPNTWQWTTGIATAKDDLNNVLLHVATDTNLHTWLIVAADRLSTAGDSYIDFEFLQNTLVRTNNGAFVSAGPDGGRTVNDLVLSLAFTGGGSVADFFAYRWLPNGTNGFSYVDSTAALPVGKVFVAANTTNVPVAFGAFGQLTYSPNAFAEAAVDLTELMRDFDPCLSIGIKTIMIKTKASQADTAAVTDFIDPIQFALQLGPSASAGPNQTQCAQGASTAFSLQGQATPGDLPIVSTTWSVVSGSALFDAPAALNTTAHVFSSTATLRLTVLQANGCVRTSDVLLTVVPPPACSISGPANTCPGSSVQLFAPPGMDAYSWSISGSGAISGPANAQMVSVEAGPNCGDNFTLTLNVTSNGCASTCSTSVLVIDTVPPTITAPPDLTLECPADTTPGNTGVASAQDDCSQVTVAFSDAITSVCGGAKTIARTWTATDACGNNATAVQNITLRDTTPPTITAPPNVTLECPADTNPSNTGTAIAQDGCSSVVLSFTDVAVNTCGGAKVITRTWTATDACGNNAAAVQTITVQDTTPPTISAPPNLILPFTADISTNTTGVANATDGCSGVTLTYVDTLSIQGDGTQVITRTWTATDGCGNNASAIQTITLDAPLSLVLPPQSDLVLTDLVTLSVINTGTNPNVPANPITYLLINPPAGATIDSNGIITWTPAANQSPSTNIITTVATTTVLSAAGTSTISTTNTFQVTLSTPYDGLDMGVDTDGDGLTNLVEFAVGSDPNNSADANAGIIIWITEDSGNHYLAMKFKRRTNADALQLQYLPEVSADKVSWYSDSNNTLSLSVVSLDSEFDWVTIRDQTPIIPSAARFIRLHIISPNRESFSPTWIGSDTLILGTGGSGSKLTVFSQRMVLPVVYAGTVSSLQNTAFTDTNATWTSSQFGAGGVAAYAEFDNGAMVDIAGSSTSKSLSLAGSLAGVASAGDAYRIRAHFTIASLFGTNNETGLKSGETAAQADNIILQTPGAQQSMVIYYYSNAFYHGWLRGDLSPADTQVVYPEQGLMVRRLAPDNRDLYLCGPIKLGVTMAPVAPGYNLVGTLKSLSPMPLSGLNLYTGDPATGLADGVTAASSDNLVVIAPDGSVQTYYYYKQVGVYEGWLDGNLTPSDNVLMTAGSAFFVKRQAAYSLFNWIIPAE